MRRTAPDAVRVALHRREVSSSGYWTHPGIATVTWVRGEPAACVVALRARLQAVLTANPWAAGRLAGRALEHPRAGADAAALVDEVLSTQRCAGVSRQARYEDIVRATSEPRLTVQSGARLQKSGGLVTKLVVVDNNDKWEAGQGAAREFALVFSMSHVVADGHDYYRVLNMVVGGAPAVRLDPVRVVAFEAREHEWTGRADFNWLSSGALVKGLVGGLLFGPKARWCCYEVDAAKVAAAKAAAVGAGEGWVSTNDVLTSQFCVATRARVVMMVVNMRGKVSVPLGDDLAGCYEGVLLLDKENYAHPARVRKCLAAGAPFTRRTDSPPLPGLCGSCPMAFITSWASFPFELRLDGVEEQLLHLPCMNMPSVMDVAVVFAPRPGMLAMLYLAKQAAPAALRGDGTVLGSSLDSTIFPDSAESRQQTYAVRAP
jgi:hypothetical protein